MAIAAIVLALTLGSLVAAGLPLLSALSGVVIGVGGTLLSSRLVGIHSLTVVLGLMLGLAVGIDYALFILNRQRRLILDQNLPAAEAAARAAGAAGNAVVFAATTVIIALLALTVVDISLLTRMALAAAATIVAAVVASLTLLPALLGIVGERICSTKVRRRAQEVTTAEASPHPIADRWSRAVTRHRYAAIAIVVGVAGVLAIPALNMNLGLPSGASYNTDTAQRQSFELISERFGAGYNGPLAVVASGTRGEALAPGGIVRINDDLSGTEGAAGVSLAGVNQDGSTAVFSVIPRSGPTSKDTAELVNRIRSAAGSMTGEGESLGVTGFAALGIDISDKLAHVLPIYLGVVIGLSLLVLRLVFRSVTVPITATVGFLLSIGTAFGANTAVFQWGWLQQLFGMDGSSPVLCLLPVIATGVLYGLAMDYQVFLVSAMKGAHTQGHRGTEAVVRGFGEAGRVVAAAAIIMISVFAGFIFNSEPMIAQVGFTLAFGILIDAFLVRMTLIPALMTAVGDKAWWLPAWLDRILPTLDVEGDALRQRLDADADLAPTA